MNPFRNQPCHPAVGDLEDTGYFFKKRRFGTKMDVWYQKRKLLEKYAQTGRSSPACFAVYNIPVSFVWKCIYRRRVY